MAAFSRQPFLFVPFYFTSGICPLNNGGFRLNGQKVGYKLLYDM
jgi:hypothetical protein